MTKFFVPGPTGHDEAADYEVFREIAEAKWGGGTSQKRVFKVRFHADGKDREVVIGQLFPSPGCKDIVVAIFERGGGYIVATVGPDGETASMIGPEQVRGVEEFEK